jgi:hypothetical protein
VVVVVRILAAAGWRAALQRGTCCGSPAPHFSAARGHFSASHFSRPSFHAHATASHFNRARFGHANIGHVNVSHGNVSRANVGNAHLAPSNLHPLATNAHLTPAARAAAFHADPHSFAEHRRLAGDPAWRPFWNHGWHPHRHLGWIGPLFWPYAYGDFFYYALWPDDYYDADPFWAYGYGDVYSAIFSPRRGAVFLLPVALVLFILSYALRLAKGRRTSFEDSTPGSIGRGGECQHRYSPFDCSAGV